MLTYLWHASSREEKGLSMSGLQARYASWRAMSTSTGTLTTGLAPTVLVVVVEGPGTEELRVGTEEFGVGAGGPVMLLVPLLLGRRG